MNTLSTYILEYLKEKNKAEVLEFGTFSLENSGAKIVTSQNNILPPAKEIFLSLNEHIYNTDFVHFIAKKENYSLETAEKFIKNETSRWKEYIQKNENFEIQNLGKFTFHNGQYTFSGERVTDFTPDYFGLEEINLMELQENSTSKNNEQEENLEENTPFNNMILWTFLFILPIAGLLVAGFLYSDTIFGKKSFNNLSIKKGTNRIETAQQPMKIDSLKIDSTRVDTIIIENNIPKNQ